MFSSLLSKPKVQDDDEKTLFVMVKTKSQPAVSGMKNRKRKQFNFSILISIVILANRPQVKSRRSKMKNKKKLQNDQSHQLKPDRELLHLPRKVRTCLSVMETILRGSVKIVVLDIKLFNSVATMRLKNQIVWQCEKLDDKRSINFSR